MVYLALLLVLNMYLSPLKIQTNRLKNSMSSHDGDVINASHIDSSLISSLEHFVCYFVHITKNRDTFTANDAKNMHSQ